MTHQPNDSDIYLDDHIHPSLSNLDITGASNKVYTNYTYYVEAPEGEMHIAVLEDENGKPVRLWGHCGKSGSIVASWIDAFVRVVSIQLEKGLITINELRNELSSTTSDNSRINYTTGVKCASGPDAIFIALTKYINDKYEELNNELESKRTTNGPRIGGR